MLFPVRINKYLADKKICSRREADFLIGQGKVNVNGKKAELGEMINDGDKVVIDGDLKELVYLAFNKPEEIITHSPQDGELSIADILKFNVEVFPLGRLDKDSRGLIILTNDGRMTDRLLNPKYAHEKEYEIKLTAPINDNFLKQMKRGVRLSGGYITQKCAIKKLDKYSFAMILTEGKKRQIRRMCSALGYKIIDLKRVRIMNIILGNLKEGQYRIILGAEKEELLKKLEL